MKNNLPEMRTFRKKINKISKGYRLKPETHRLIHKIQRSINGDQDEAIMAACMAFFLQHQFTISEQKVNPGKGS
jgi:hypothetical protein